jgi:hypothetical protein
LAFSRSSPPGHGIVRRMAFVSRSNWMISDGPISKRSASLVAARVTMMRKRCFGSGSNDLMRTFFAPWLSVNVPIVERVAMSRISRISMSASMV